MKLIAITEETLNAPDVSASEFLSDVCQATLSMYAGSDSTPPWVGYLAQVGGAWVGTCAFKSQPKAGSVEIAYFTFPEHEGRGIATRMASELISIAGAQGVKRLTAQTQPQANASTRILEKLGFANSGTVLHPEDGEVWEWMLE